MKGNREYNNGRQLHIEDYLQENKLEEDEISNNGISPTRLLFPKKFKFIS